MHDPRLGPTLRELHERCSAHWVLRIDGTTASQRVCKRTVPSEDRSFPRSKYEYPETSVTVIAAKSPFSRTAFSKATMKMRFPGAGFAVSAATQRFNIIETFSKLRETFFF